MLANVPTDRLRRKNEALANEIFGRGRRSSLPNTGNRRLGSGPSFASRVGIAKVCISRNIKGSRRKY